MILIKKSKIFKSLALIGMFSGLATYGQVKIGNNPTKINSNTNLEVEAANGSILSVSKDKGKVTIKDGSQGDGKVLTSDTNGVATWMLPKSGSILIENQPGKAGSPGLPGSPGGPGEGITLVTNDSGTWIFNSTTNTWTNISGIKGENGVSGKDGKDGKDGQVGTASGAGAPGIAGTPGAPGKDITIYTDITTGIVYVQNPDGNWTPINGKDGQVGTSSGAGAPGIAGSPGAPGKDINIYTDTTTGTVYVQNPDGTWTSINGKNGNDGKDGQVGTSSGVGAPGIAGSPGAPGKDINIYTDTTTGTVYVQNPDGTWTPINGKNGNDGKDGQVGTASGAGAPGIAGTPGAPGKDINIYTDTTTGTVYVQNPDGTWTPINGKDGKSAFEIWKELPGNDGKTITEYLDGLKGADGLAGTNGTNGTDGVDGKSAYEIWKELPGNDGKTITEYLDGLKGADGLAGTNGTNGVDGAPGPQGGIGLIINGTNTTVTGAGTTVDPYKINTPATSLTQNTATGVITQTNEANITATANVVSSDAGNLVKVGTDGGAKLLQSDINASTTVSNTSSVNSLTTTVNGVTGDAVTIVNSNNLSVDANGKLTSTVNGVANSTPVQVVVDANNGLTPVNGVVQLGGALIKPTAIKTNATNTLAISGLQNTATPATDKVLVVDAATGVVKTQAASESEPWYDMATNQGATLNTQEVYIKGKAAIGTTQAAQVYANGVKLAELTVAGGDASINGITVGRGGGQQIDNVAVGNQALYNATTAIGNVANGNQAMFTNTSGSENVAIGNQALFSNVSGAGNVAIGNQAMNNNVNGGTNTAIGNQALFNNIDGQNNIASGSKALLSFSSGFYNTALGVNAGYLQTSGNFNIVIGSSGGSGLNLPNVSGSNQMNIGNTIFGTGTNTSTVGAGNIGIGTTTPATKLEVKSATANTSGLRLTNLTNATPVTAGTTTIGVNANGDVVTTDATATAWKLNGNTGTTANTAVGANYIGTTDQVALDFRVGNQQAGWLGYQTAGIGTSSVYFGINAGLAGAVKTNGAYNNIGIGDNALASNTSNSNVAIGGFALQNSVSGYNNSAVGYNALQHNTTGDSNTAMGSGSLQNNTTGVSNIGIGTSAGTNNTVGNNNMFIGSNANLTSSGLNVTNATAIGTNAKVGASNSIVLGGTGVDAVNVGIGTTTPANRLEVNSGATNTSGLRLTNLTSATSVTAGATVIGVNATGDVVTAALPPTNVLKNTFVNTNYTVLPTDNVILVNATSGNITVTLPATPVDGVVYTIKRVGADISSNNVIISGGTINIDDSVAPYGTTTTVGANVGYQVMYSTSQAMWFTISKL